MPMFSWSLLARSSHDDPDTDLLNVIIGNKTKKSSLLASQIINGDVQSILDDQTKLISSDANLTNAKDLINKVKSMYNEEKTEETFSNGYLLSAVAHLTAFVQINFTGPSLDFSNFSSSPELRSSCIDWLSSDGESAFKLCHYPELLVAAYAGITTALVQAPENSVSQLVSRWWYCRAIIIRQSLLNDPSATFYNEFVEKFPSIAELQSFGESKKWADNLLQDLKILHYVEEARALLVYGQETKAQTAIMKAKELSGLQTDLTGVKGKRTKFQTKETVQLVYLAKSGQNNDETTVTNESTIIPAKINLDSDLFMEKIALTDSSNEDDKEKLNPALRDIDPNSQPALKDIDSAIILLEIDLLKATSPFKNNLVQEEMNAMVNRLIDAPKSTVNWSIFSRALWERSLLESDSPRTVERGTLQIQSLVEELGQNNLDSNLSNDESNKDTTEERLKYIHQLVPLPRWALDIKLAQKFMSLGAVKSAAEIYERLELWSDVALCYAVAGEETKAIEILKEHVEKNPKDARAWCIWGDITNNPEYWEKSWEVGRFAAAKRALGRYYFNPPKESGLSRDTEAAIEHFRDSLTVNPLNVNAWFAYGCIGLETEKWELAAEAFTRCVSIEEFDAKSWSNLATALLQMNKKKEAFSALQKAIRADSDMKNWKIWENFIAVAVDVGDWNQALMGVNRLIDLRGKSAGEAALNVNVLNMLVHILVERDYEDSQHISNVFAKNCIALFIEKIPPLITTNAQLWKLVAKVHMWLKQPWNTLSDYEKAFRIYANSPDIETSETIWQEAVAACEDVVMAYTNLGPREGRMGEGSQVCKDWKFKAKSSIRSLQGKGRTSWEGTAGWDQLETMKEEL